MLFGMALFFLYVGAELSIGLWSNSYFIEKMGLAASVSGYLVAWYCIHHGGSFLVWFCGSSTGQSWLDSIGIVHCIGWFIGDVCCGRCHVSSFGVYRAMRLGLAPLYPAMMHETPRRFKEDLATRLIGYQVGIAKWGVMIITAACALFNLFDLSIF